MMFFYKVAPIGEAEILYEPRSVCKSIRYGKRSTFLSALESWNRLYVGRFTFEEVPISCVKKLFGELEFDFRYWPQQEFK